MIDQVTTALAFFGAPNDVAVSMEAIGKIPKSLGQPPLIHELACDHLTHFSSEAGVHGRVKVLHENS